MSGVVVPFRVFLALRGVEIGIASVVRTYCHYRQMRCEIEDLRHQLAVIRSAYEQLPADCEP